MSYHVNGWDLRRSLGTWGGAGGIYGGERMGKFC